MAHIVIDNLPPSHERMLSQWASVQRTITEARRLLLNCTENEDVTTDAIHACVDELGDIGPALDCLHQLVRNQLWAQQKK